MTDVSIASSNLTLPAAKRSRGQLVDSALHLAAAASGVVILLMMGMLLAVLIYAAVPSVKTFGLKFFVDFAWRPNALEKAKRTADGKIVRDADGEAIMETIPPAFGALPVIYGTA